MEILNFNIQARHVFAEHDVNREHSGIEIRENNKQEIHHLLTRLDDHVSNAIAHKYVVNNVVINYAKGAVSKVYDTRHKVESKLPFNNELREQSTSHTNIAKTGENIDTTQLALRNDRLRRNSEMAKIEKKLEDIANVSVLRHAYESNNEGKRSESYGKFWDKIAEDIASIKKEYVEFYATLISKYADFYQVFVKLQGEIAGVVSEGKDGNHIKFNNEKKMEAFKHFREARDAIKLPKIEGWSEENLTDEQKQLRENLKPAFIIDKKGQVKIDDTAYQNLPNEPAGRDEDNNVNMASYNAWMAAFNTMGNIFQSNMQSMSQRYTQANSTFDNLNKVLSSTITALLECAKSFLHF
ncbi:IpaD/SipD/SspD family type III secretion system needle tip protein [Sodalis endosymbiont of Spalangia cameroni]|uniref:IpaD/SipD/SspD family type III secretion system needle tip protein n=1 Tax=Sodalis praecaptivus TaxID=1239307 RepID=UPI0031F8A25F